MAFYPDLIPVNYFIGKKILSRGHKVTHVEVFYNLMGKGIIQFCIHISDSTSNITTIIQGNAKTVCHQKSISLGCTCFGGFGVTAFIAVSPCTTLYSLAFKGHRCCPKKEYHRNTGLVPSLTFYIKPYYIPLKIFHF